MFAKILSIIMILFDYSVTNFLFLCSVAIYNITSLLLYYISGVFGNVFMFIIISLSYSL